MQTIYKFVREHIVYEPRQSDVSWSICRLQFYRASRSAGFNFTVLADFLSAQSNTELRLTDLQISDYLNIHGMLFRLATYKKLLQYTFKKNKVGLRQHLITFRDV